MDALILSCGTGGGHNAAGEAVCEELKKRGYNAEFLDPFTLRSDRVSKIVSNTYIKLAQRCPHVFGAAYQLAEFVRLLPGKSPVYFANRKTATKLGKFLHSHHYDVVIMTHLFPAEMITHLKKHGEIDVPTVFIATDYTCIPFTEETNCDYYIAPGEAQVDEFVKRGIPKEKIRPFGIPLAGVYYSQIDCNTAKRTLGLDEKKEYVFLAGGSIGAGKVFQAAKTLKRYYAQNSNTVLIVACGNNKKLLRKMRKLEDDRLIALGATNQMALYMQSSSLFLSKAGGLSSTEAAISKRPFIQIPSIPGCETHNQAYFSVNGMSIAVKDAGQDLLNAVRTVTEQYTKKTMTKAQETAIPQNALSCLCDWLEEIH